MAVWKRPTRRMAKRSDRGVVPAAFDPQSRSSFRYLPRSKNTPAIRASRARPGVRYGIDTFRKGMRPVAMNQAEAKVMPSVLPDFTAVLTNVVGSRDDAEQIRG